MVPRSIPLIIGGPSLGAPPMQLSTFIPDAVAATREAPSSTFPRRIPCGSVQGPYYYK